MDIPINWEPILWVGGGFGAIISLLLGIIASLIKGERASSKEERRENREAIRLFTEEMKGQKMEIHELRLDTKVSMEIIKAEQQNNNQRLEMFEKYLGGVSFVKKRK